MFKNTELKAFGVRSYTSPDKTTVLINDEGMSKVMDFFEGKSHSILLTDQQVMYIETVVDFANKSKVDLL